MDHGAGLVGRDWQVVQLGGTATGAQRPALQFLDDGRLVGTTGVNRVMGQYQTRWSDGRLVVSFGPAATTLMAGPPEAMEQEQRVLALLQGEHTVEVVGDRMRVDPFEEPDGSAGEAALLVAPAVEPAV